MARVIEVKVKKRVDPVDPKGVYWCGDPGDTCQISGEPFDGVMYDARTPYGWANICQNVFTRHGCRLGTGFGQKYELQNNGRWMKTAG